MNPTVTDFKNNGQKTIAQLKEELKGIRTGRSNPGMLEDLVVETYGGSAKLKLMELATISTEGAGQLAITPYDSSTTGDIEKAILKSPLGLTPSAHGGKILIKIPPLSEEQRQKITKFIHQKIEEKKVILRNHRDDSRKKVKQMFDAKDITEDQRFRIEKDIDTAIQQLNEEIQTVKEHKDKEIMEV